jgi:hypothetical protein
MQRFAVLRLPTNTLTHILCSLPKVLLYLQEYPRCVWACVCARAESEDIFDFRSCFSCVYEYCSVDFNKCHK